jgi:hypothetical protein
VGRTAADEDRQSIDLSDAVVAFNPAEGSAEPRSSEIADHHQ